MRRGLVVVAALALAGTLAFPSLAAPLSPADRVAEDVHLAPSDGPNGDYASLADGELVVDLSAANPVGGDGVNPGGVTTVDDVFRVRYDGSRVARVWFTHGTDAITVRARGHPVQSAARGVVLAPNDSVAVGLVVDTTGPRGERVGALTVHARVADPGGDRPTTVDANDDGDDGPSIRQFVRGERRRRITLSNAPVGRPVALGLDRLEVDRAGGGTLTLDGLDVTTTDGSVGVDVRVGGPNAATRGPVPDGERLGTVSVDADGGVRGVQARFSVARSYLDAVGATPSDLAVYRRVDDEWRRLNASVAGRDDRVAFGVNASAAATLAVASRNGSDGGRTRHVASASKPDRLESLASDVLRTTRGRDGRGGSAADRPGGIAARSERSARNAERRLGVGSANGSTPTLLAVVAVAGVAILAGRRSDR